MKNLQRIRKEHDLSQLQLADASGVNLRMLQKYENGEKDINKAAAITVYQLAKTLNVNMVDLLEIGKDN